ncbi:hypothetical protein ACHAQH_007097 [Verticillium albo-atrum]
MAAKTSSSEKRDETKHVELEEQLGENEKIMISGADGTLHYDPKETKRLLRMIDWHVLPPWTVLCILAFIDRSNIGNARIGC